MPRRHKEKNLPDNHPHNERLSSSAWTTSTTNDSKSDAEIDLSQYAAQGFDQPDVRFGSIGQDLHEKSSGNRRRSKLTKEQQDELLQSVLPPKIGSNPDKVKTRRRRGEHSVAHRFSGHTEAKTTNFGSDQQSIPAPSFFIDTDPAHIDQQPVQHPVQPVSQPLVQPPTQQPQPPAQQPVQQIAEPIVTTHETQEPITEKVEENPYLSITSGLQGHHAYEPDLQGKEKKQSIFEMAPEKLVDADFMREDSASKIAIPKVDIEKIKTSKIARVLWANKIAFSVAACLFIISAFFLFRPTAEPPKKIPIPNEITDSSGKPIIVEPDQNDVTVTLPPGSNTQFDQNGNPTG